MVVFLLADVVRLVYLRHKINGTHNGASHELREKADEKREVQEPVHRFQVSPVNIH